MARSTAPAGSAASDLSGFDRQRPDGRGGLDPAAWRISSRRPAAGRDRTGVHFGAPHRDQWVRPWPNFVRDSDMLAGVRPLRAPTSRDRAVRWPGSAAGVRRDPPDGLDRAADVGRHARQSMGYRRTCSSRRLCIAFASSPISGKSPTSMSRRISISAPSSCRAGQRFIHSITSSNDFACTIQ